MKKLTVKAENRLERFVKAWINNHVKDYDSVENLARDLNYCGCASGMVGELIYTTDCVEFFNKYKVEINSLFRELLSDCGTTPDQLFGNQNSLQWDKEDPLCMDANNQNILAWFGFETTASNLFNRAGIES
jgi:hypothetical protein